MKIVNRTSKVVVIDDLIPQDQFNNLWVHIQAEKFRNPHADKWEKVWRLTDGNCVSGQNYQLSNKPFNNYMDAVSSYMLAACKYAQEIAGNQGQHWIEASFKSYLYPRGTKLSWHNDAGSYQAALTYYVHPYWGSTWGGELMTADVPDFKELKEQPRSAPHLEHKWEDELVGTRGKGEWIFPKPNRLVIMAGGVYHSINRVDNDAGDHARCSIVCFLIKDQDCKTGDSNKCS
jgi:hypothetical protein